MSFARASTACSASSPSARTVIFSPFLASPVIFRTLLAFTSRFPLMNTTCEENPLAAFTICAAGLPWMPSSGPTVVSLSATQRSSHKTRYTRPMIPLLAFEFGYDFGCRPRHEPRVRGDVDEPETLLDHARGVNSGAGKDACGEAAPASGGKHPIHGLDDLGLFAVHAGSVPEALAQVGGPDEDRIEARDIEDLV